MIKSTKHISGDLRTTTKIVMNLGGNWSKTHRKHHPSSPNELDILQKHLTLPTPVTLMSIRNPPRLLGTASRGNRSLRRRGWMKPPVAMKLQGGV